MARVEFGSGVTDIKGSIGGCTFQHNRSGAIVRSRPKVRKKSTQKQQRSHLDQNIYLAHWQLLDLAERQLWNDYADVWEREDMFGNLRRLTGLNWFTSINRYRVLVGVAIDREPPPHVLPVSVPPFALCITDTDITINFGTPFNPPNTSLIIRSTSPYKRVSNSIASNLRETLIQTSPPWTEINLTSSWEGTHDLSFPPSVPPYGFFIGISIQTVENTSGIASSALFANGEILQSDVGINEMVIQCTFVVRPISGILFMQIGTTFIVS